MIRLKHLHTYAGPNVYAVNPAIVVGLNTEPDDCVKAIDQFKLISRHFIRWSPAAFHGNACDESGIGDYLVSLAQWLLNDVRGFIRTAKCISTSTGTLLVLGYHDPDLSMLALRIAVRMFEHIDGTHPEKLGKTVNQFSALCRSRHPDYQATILMQAAYNLDIPVLSLIHGTRFWQYGWGSRSRIFMESLSNADGSIASILSENKLRSKAFFSSLGMPTPESRLVSSVADLPAAITQIGYPCALKPLDCGGGKGVTANLRTHDQVARALKAARQYSAGPLMLERFIQGEDHRLMAIDGQFMAAFRREPAHVVGDGARTIKQLIHALNENRSINMISSQYFRPIAFDQIIEDHLASQGIKPEDIPETGRRLSLRSNANLSTGGMATDVTAMVHPSLKAMVAQMADSAGFGAAGFDYITTDISQSPWESGGAFIEMNTTPGIDIAVNAGWHVTDIGTRILGNAVGRIPIDLHVVKQMPESLGSADAQIPARRFDAIVAGHELRVGEAVFRVEDNSPWAAVKAALRNKTIESLQIVCALEDILSHGLPVDRIARLTTDGVIIPADWMSVLTDCSGEITDEWKFKQHHELPD